MSLLELPKSAAKLGFRVARLPLTTFEVFTGRRQPETSEARMAQQGLVGGAVGKVKQVAGIVLGDEDLLVRGRQQEHEATETGGQRQDREQVAEQPVEQRSELEERAARAKEDQVKREAAREQAETAKKQRAAAAKEVVTSVEAADRDEAADEAERKAEALARARART